METKDNPFELQEHDRVIACVGNNGGTDNYSIKEGFKRSVQILIESLEKGSEYEDLLVYPIVYNARHSIELSLKIIIENIWTLQEIKGEKSKEQIYKDRELLHTHDIEKLHHIVESIAEVDRRILPQYKEAETYLSDYYFDTEGDAFKYESDKVNIPHMIAKGISHISIDTLGNQFNKLIQILDRLIHELDYMVSEYKLGCYTKHLSRYDIEAISKQLLPRTQWKQDDFSVIKEKIKAEYGIGSKEYSDVLNIIQNHRKFCVNIGMEKTFGNITDEELNAYANLVINYFNISKEQESHQISVLDAFSLDDIQRLNKYRQEISTILSNQTLNLLMAFLDIGRNNTFAEYLEKIYAHCEESYFNRLYMIRKIEKRNAFSHILLGMLECGQKTYFNKLTKTVSENGITPRNFFK